MKDDSVIEFRCVNGECGEILSFSIMGVGEETEITCPSCQRAYRFNRELLGKFKKFANLVEAVREAEEILGHTNVGLDIQGHSVKVPYRLLLTRMNTFLNLEMGGKSYNFRLRVEPLRQEADD